MGTGFTQNGAVRLVHFFVAADDVGSVENSSIDVTTDNLGNFDIRIAVKSPSLHSAEVDFTDLDSGETGQATIEAPP
jgi:hypothetical protein